MENVENTPTLPSQQQPTTPAPVQGQQPESKPHVLASSIPEEALTARLEAAKRTGQTELLKSLGVTDAAQLKGAIDALKAAEDAKRTDAEKLANLLAEKQTNEAKLGEYAKAIDSVWASESTKLTTEQLAAITALAGDDSAKRIQALNALRPTWVAAQTQTTTAPTTAPKPLATTAAPAAAPTPTVTESTIDHAAEWQRLREINPPRAALYLEQHEREIFK